MEKKKNTPKLRFPEFTGEWEEKKLGEIFRISAGGDIDSKHVSKERTEKFNYPIYANTERDKGLYGYSDVYKIESGVVTVTGRGVNIGIAHARNHKFYPIVRLLVLEPLKEENIYFYEYQINRLNLYKESTGVPQLTAPQISIYCVCFPQLIEQTKIATFLTAVDEKLTQLKKKKTLLEQYKKGVMQKLFSQELRFKDDNNQDFPDWQELPLDKTADIVGGGTPDTSNELLWNGNIQWFTPTELKFKYVKFSNRNITDEGLKQSSAKLLPAGTVLFSSRATIGDASITLKECATNQGFQSFVVGDNLYNEYLYYWIINNKNVFLMKASGSTFLEISKNEVAKINIELPSLPEQQKIANFLSAIDEKISHCGAQIEKMEAWKKGLLQQMFC